MARAATTSDAFNAVSEPRRREILVFLADRERPVNEIVAALGMAQPQVSKRLRVLRQAGLVRMRCEGRRKLYRTEAAALRPLQEWADEFERLWRNTLERVKERAERNKSMSIAEALLNEYNEQAPLTRRFLERLPEDKLHWRPHPKSLTAGQLALHLARVPASVAAAARQNPAPAPNFNSLVRQPETLAEVLAEHDAGAAAVRAELGRHDDAAMREIWRMKLDGRDLFAVPREKFLRDVMFSHWYQHRGQFGVYLRLLNVPVPSTWGPSADEPPQAQQNQSN